MENKLQYNNLTHADIMSRVNSMFSGDEFRNFRESSLAQTIFEVFAGTADMINYYIGRRSEECFMDTAQHKSSIVNLSRMFGYSIIRPEPAKAKLRLVIKTPPPVDVTYLEIPAHTKVSYSGLPFITKTSFKYYFNKSGLSFVDTFPLVLTEDSFGNSIDIVQGEISEHVILGDTNIQMNMPFQSYRISDTSFSNLFGDSDYFSEKVCKVSIGSNRSVAEDFEIDRKSLLNWENISGSSNVSPKKVCLIRTASDDGVDILFGDGDATSTGVKNGYARKGAIAPTDNIYIQYFSTKGKSANKVGVISKTVDFGGSVLTNTSFPVTNNCTFEFISNILGGADIESSESIKYSTPKMFYTMDRLVTKSDYVAFLKTLTSPIDVKNAIAWGEQEERDAMYGVGDIIGLVKMFNVVIFTLSGSLYQDVDNVWTRKVGSDLQTAFLDDTYDINAMQTQGYLNVFVFQDIVRQIKQYSVKRRYRYLSSDSIQSVKSALQSIVNSDSEMVLRFNFTSDIYYAGIVGDVLISLNVPSVLDAINATYSDDTVATKTIMTAICSVLNSRLFSLLDNRDKQLVNGAFKYDGNICEYDSATNKIGFYFDLSTGGVGGNSYSYITKFINNTFSDIVGLTDSTMMEKYKNYTCSELNFNIADVVQKLDTKSQLNVKNVYVSPILHVFDMIGTIYIKSFYDKSKVLEEIQRKVYSWADMHADFGVELFLSNILEVIESHEAVINADVRLYPRVNGLVMGDGKNDFFSMTDTSKSYNNVLPTTVYNKIISMIDEYLGVDSEQLSYWVRNSIYLNTRKSLYDETVKINTKVTERSFYTLVAEIYKMLTTVIISDTSSSRDRETVREFLGVIDESLVTECTSYSVVGSPFADMMNDLHRELSYIIMTNMLDSWGNIAVERDVNGKYLRGGYSLNTEIVQLNMEDHTLLQVSYK